MKHIVFRVDSSTQIGTGHLMRCLTLADALKNIAMITFISRDLQGNLNHLIKAKGHCLLQLPRGEQVDGLLGYEQWLTVPIKLDADQTKKLLGVKFPDYIIIDHYAIDESWELMLRSYAKKIMVIDDLANRKHHCDILLDQNYYCDMDNRYTGLVPDGCKLLLGPQYVLLREEFYKARNKIRHRDGVIKNILVFFGGSDLTNETMKVLKAIEKLQSEDIAVNVVVGERNLYKKNVELFCQQHENIYYYCQVNNMADLMNQADLAIGAGGTTIWERLFLGLPTIVIAIAENQVKICEDCDRAGFIKYLGQSSNIIVEDIRYTLEKLIRENELENFIDRFNDFKYDFNDKFFYEYFKNTIEG